MFFGFDLDAVAAAGDLRRGVVLPRRGGDLVAAAGEAPPRLRDTPPPAALPGLAGLAGLAGALGFGVAGAADLLFAAGGDLGLDLGLGDCFALAFDLGDGLARVFGPGLDFGCGFCFGAAALGDLEVARTGDLDCGKRLGLDLGGGLDFGSFDFDFASDLGGLPAAAARFPATADLRSRSGTASSAESASDAAGAGAGGGAAARRLRGGGLGDSSPLSSSLVVSPIPVIR